MQSGPRAGDRSADGSRVFDGKYWVLQRGNLQIQESDARWMDEPRPRLDFTPERGGFGFGGLIVATVVGLVLAYAPYPGIPSESLNSALQELAISILIRTWGTFIAVFLILSVGRRPIDFQLFRSMIVGFVLGFVFGLGFVGLFSVFPIPGGPRQSVIILPFLEGAIFAVILGPTIFVATAIANLLWYRSFSAMKPWLLSRRAKR